jgi:hypothetical protein
MVSENDRDGTTTERGWWGREGVEPNIKSYTTYVIKKSRVNMQIPGPHQSF